MASFAFLLPECCYSVETDGVPVCRGEQKALSLFREYAKRSGYDPKYKPVQGSGIAEVEFRASDAVVLTGYLAPAHSETGTPVVPRGYILILLGNEMFAQQIVTPLRELAGSSFDAYVYDYRGYRDSSIPMSIERTIEDVKEIVQSLNSSQVNHHPKYDARIVYGISAGGAVALNSLDDAELVDRLILDGVPARMSLDLRPWFFPFVSLLHLDCPASLDPVSRPFVLAPHSLVIQGSKDEVLRKIQRSEDQNAFLKHACGRRASVVLESKWGHPFQDDHTGDRIALIKSVIAGTRNQVESTSFCESAPTL